MMKGMAIVFASVVALCISGCSASGGAGSTAMEETVVKSTQTTTAGNVEFTLEGEWEQDSIDQGVKFSNDDGVFVSVQTAHFDYFASDTGAEAVQLFFMKFEDAGAKVDQEVIQNFVGEAPIWQYSFTSDDNGQPVTGMGAVFMTGNDMSIIQMGAPSDVYDEVKPMLDKVMDGIEYLSTEPLVMLESNQEYEQVEQGPATSMQGGTYLVGTDIAAGTYKLTANVDSGYWDIKLSVDAAAEIVANDFFENMTYVTVFDGQYLSLSDCTGVLQQ